MSKLVSIGKIVNFHGIKGEVKMGFTAGKEDLVKNLKQVFVFKNDNKIQLDIDSLRFHKNFAIIKFKQINSINEVDEIKGLLVHTTEDKVISELQEDEYLVKDLVGLAVYDTDGNEIGVVADLGENKASNLIEVKKTNGLTFMVPFVKELVPAVDLQNKKIIIKLLEGMDTSKESVGSEE